MPTTINKFFQIYNFGLHSIFFSLDFYFNKYYYLSTKNYSWNNFSDNFQKLIIYKKYFSMYVFHLTFEFFRYCNSISGCRTRWQIHGLYQRQGNLSRMEFSWEQGRKDFILPKTKNTGSQSIWSEVFI